RCPQPGLITVEQRLELTVRAARERMSAPASPTRLQAGSPLPLAILGLGTVGTGVARVLTQHAERVARRAGRPIEWRRAVVRDLHKPRDIELPAGVITDDVQQVIADPEIKVAVQLMGGI